MASVKKFNKSNPPVTPVPNDGSAGPLRFGGMIPVRFLVYIIGGLALAYYINSLGGGFVMDDAIVIIDNQYTLKGISGWPGIFENDTFYGFFREVGKDHLVAGGRYRPLSLALFALEGQVFGFNPGVFHFFNVLYFAFSCMLLFNLMRKLLTQRFNKETVLIISFFTALIFTIHPIHTEVVANIKGRDEILCCLFGLLSTYFMWMGVRDNKIGRSILSGVFIFLSLLSKENGIVFLALAPLAVWFFSTDKKIKNIIIHVLPMLIFTLIYLGIRQSVLGTPANTGPIMELMNNPFLVWQVNGYLPVETGQKLATISVTLLKYLVLMIFPHPLTSDYYPKQIAITSWSDIKAILGLLTYLTMIIVCLIRFRKKELPVYGLIFFLIALFPMSNLLFPVGTLMSERFLFIPGIGISIVLAWFISKYLVRNNLFSRVNLLIGAIILLLGIKTIARNNDWKDNFTLFTTDVKVSSNSAKMRNSAGGVLVDSASKIKDPVLKNQMLDEAQSHLMKAVEIHPSYSNAYLLLGNAQAYKEDFAAAAVNYELALKYNPNFMDAKINLALAWREVGKAAGEKEGNLVKALELLKKSLALNPKDPETNRLLGVAVGISGKPQEALNYFLKAHNASPDNAFYMFDLGSAYANVGNTEKANYYHAEAIKRDPSLQQRLLK